MGRRSAALVLGVGLALGVSGRVSRAEGSGLWEAEQRLGFKQALRQSVGDVLHEPRLSWQRGPVLSTRRKALVVHVGYEGQFDAVWYGAMDEAVETAAGASWQSGFEVRRSRIALETFFLRDWYVRARYGVGSFRDFTFQDLFVEWSGLTRLPGDWWPLLRAGQVKEPMTIDWMTNGLRTTFAERAMFVNAILPLRNPGVCAHGVGAGKRVTYELGAYLVNAASLSDRRDGDGEAVTGRITALPWAPADRPNHLLHVGLAASWRWDVGEHRARAKPGSWVGPDIVDTGSLATDSVTVVAAELFHQQDRLSFAAEGAWTRVNLAGGGSLDYWGCYGQVSWFLTAGHLTYNRTFGCLGRVMPSREVFCPARRGYGDLELAARWSILDLDAGPSPGGRAWNALLGLNWYARDNLRVTCNYVFSHVTDAYGVHGADGTMSTLLVRLGYDL